MYSRVEAKGAALGALEENMQERARRLLEIALKHEID